MNKCKGFSRLWFLAALLVAIMAGCATNGGDPGTLVSISVTPATTSIPVTGTVQFMALATYGDGSARDVTADSTWNAGTNGVTFGAIKGRATGVIANPVPVIISATYKGKTATAAVTVNGSTSVSFKVTPPQASTPVTGTQQFTATETFSDGSSFDRTAVATWTAANLPLGGTAVATVSSSAPTKGVATGKAVGTSTITATFGSLVATATLTVNAATPVAFTVTPATTFQPVSGIRQYTALETFSDGSTIDRTAVATWSTTDLVGSGVASILPGGMARAVAAGQSTITARYNGRTATAILTVNAVTSVSFTVTPQAAYLPITGTRSYTALETFSDGSTVDRTAVATWTAIDRVGSGVATILPNGIATGVAAGQSTITARYNGKTATAILTVNPATSVSLTVTPATASIPITGTRSYTALETFSDGSTVDRTAVATWSAPDFIGTNVATISSTGVATGTAAGQSTITARYNGRTATARLTVNAATPVSFTVTPSTASIPVSGTRSYTALETFSDGSTIDRTLVAAWTAPDLIGSGVATISPTGIATGAAPGQATITARYNGIAAIATLTVTGSTSVSFTVTPATSSIPISGSRQYTALQTFSDGSTIDRTAVAIWTAPDLIGVGVASILPGGLANGNAAGQATITASYNGMVATARLTVTAASVVSFSVTPATTSIAVNGTRQYTALETYSDGTSADRTSVSLWSAPDVIGVGVASITPSGLATGNTAGQANVTAIYNGRTATARLIVTATPVPPPSGDILATYGIAAYGGISNAGATKINGDVVLDPTATCNLVPILFADGPGFGLCGGNILNIPTHNAGDKVITPTYPDTTTSASVMIALTAKWTTYSPAGRPGATVLGCGTIGSAGGAGAGIGCSGNNTLPPGTYISATGSSIGVTGDLILDAGGNANAVWVFQAPTALTTAVSSKIILLNGAKASNIWWYVGSSASILGGTTFQGNVLASASISMGSGATSCGRLLAGAGGSGAFTFLNNTVSVPGHPSGPASCQ